MQSKKTLFITAGFGLFFAHGIISIPELFYRHYNIEFTDSWHLLPRCNSHPVNCYWKPAAEFRRMFKEEILENQRRSKIYQTVRSNPGLHIRQLQQCLRHSPSKPTIPFELYGKKKRYNRKKKLNITQDTTVSPLETEEKKLLSILRQRRLREIVVIILLSKKAKYQFIVETTNVPASTVSFYLRCLMESNIIERTKIGYENVYTLKRRKIKSPRF